MDKPSVKKGVKKRKYIIFFLLFFVIGAVGGAFGTYKALGLKLGGKEETEVVEGVLEEDITKSSEYANLISQLYGYLVNDNIFYSSNGVDISNMANEDKLRIVYEYMEQNKMYEEEVSSPVYYGALTCANNFSLDLIISSDGTSSNGNSCTIHKFNIEEMIDTYKKLFLDENIDTTVSFNPSNYKMCNVIDSLYYCGNTINVSGISGVLTSKFEIIKVIKNQDTIVIYDKGYLVDTRSNVVNPNDGYDNYYLHSSDSNMYYYELKSADNLIFAHTFKIGEDGTYRYLKTVVAQ